jgi:hypothetical protein
MKSTEDSHGYFGTEEYKIKMIDFYWNLFQESDNE